MSVSQQFCHLEQILLLMKDPERQGLLQSGGFWVLSNLIKPGACLSNLCFSSYGISPSIVGVMSRFLLNLTCLQIARHRGHFV